PSSPALPHLHSFPTRRSSDLLAPGGIIYHVLNRGVARMTLFRSHKDYIAFLRAIIETLDAIPMRILAFCIMPNHWHLVLWPRKEDRKSTRLNSSHDQISYAVF